MSDRTIDQLEPISVTELFQEFSDFTLAELVLEIKEGREALEYEKKAHAADEFARTKAELQCAELQKRIADAGMALSGEVETTDEIE